MPQLRRPQAAFVGDKIAVKQPTKHAGLFRPPLLQLSRHVLSHRSALHVM